MQLDEPLRDERNNPRARISFKQRTFWNYHSLEKFYLSGFLVTVLALTQRFLLWKPSFVSHFVKLNITYHFWHRTEASKCLSTLLQTSKLFISKLKRGFRSKLRFIKSFNSFQSLVFLPRSCQLLSSRNSITYFSFAKSASLKFFFETVVARRTISNLSSSLLRFRVNNVAKAWFVLLNFNWLRVWSETRCQILIFMVSISKACS